MKTLKTLDKIDAKKIGYAILEEAEKRGQPVAVYILDITQKPLFKKLMEGAKDDYMVFAKTKTESILKWIILHEENFNTDKSIPGAGEGALVVVDSEKNPLGAVGVSSRLYAYWKEDFDIAAKGVEDAGFVYKQKRGGK